MDPITDAIKSSIEGLSDRDVESVDTDAVDDTDTGEGDEALVVDDVETPVEEAVVEEDKEPVVEEAKLEGHDDPEVEALAKELGLKPDKNGKFNRIPYPQVAKIIRNREAKAVETVAKVLGVDAKTLKFDSIETALTERVTALSRDAQDIDDMRVAEKIMTTDGDEYVRILAKIDPDRYSKFLTVLGDGTKADPKPIATTDEDEILAILQNLPGPDLPMDDKGNKTYSVAGIQKALKEAVIAAVKLGDKRAAARAKEEVKPLVDKEKAAQERVQKQQRMDADLAEAQTWDGMDEYFTDVLEAMKTDPGHTNGGKFKYRSIKDAYLAVVPKKLREKGNVSEQTMRKKILEEMKKTPKSTSVGSDSAASKVVETSSDPIEAAIRRSIRNHPGRK